MRRRNTEYKKILYYHDSRLSIGYQLQKFDGYVLCVNSRTDYLSLKDKITCIEDYHSNINQRDKIFIVDMNEYCKFSKIDYFFRILFSIYLKIFVNTFIISKNSTLRIYIHSVQGFHSRASILKAIWLGIKPYLVSLLKYIMLFIQSVLNILILPFFEYITTKSKLKQIKKEVNEIDKFINYIEEEKEEFVPNRDIDIQKRREKKYSKYKELSQENSNHRSNTLSIIIPILAASIPLFLTFSTITDFKKENEILKKQIKSQNDYLTLQNDKIDIIVQNNELLTEKIKNNETQLNIILSEIRSIKIQEDEGSE